MILPEGTPASPTKTDRALSTDSPAQSSGSRLPPPAYSPNPPPPANHGATPLIPRVKSRPSASRRACVRFTKALLIAVLICFLFSALVGSIADLGRARTYPGDWGHERPSWPGRDKWSTSDGCQPNWPPYFTHPAGLRAQVDLPDLPSLPGMGSKAPYRSTATFYLNPAAPSLLLVAKNTWGDVTLKAGGQQSEEIKVNVVVHYWSEEARSRASVCELVKRDGSQGIGIYVPQYHGSRRRPEDQLSFSVEVIFPSTDGALPLYIKSLETELPIFTHRVYSIDGKVNFGELKLQSSNARITADSLFAETALVKTTNAAIEGTFHSNRSLSLETENGKIQITAELEFNDGSHAKTRAKKTSLKMITTNAQINSSTKLISPNSKRGGTFDMSAHTSNGAIRLTFPSSPPSSKLTLNAATTNARNDVLLHPAYEGIFSASTSSYMGAPALSRGSDQDPSGDGRIRLVEVKTAGKGQLSGRASWGPWKSRNNYGEVVISSSNGPISLSI